MRPLLRSPAQRIAAGVVGIGLLAVGFVPLFGGPGYEHALASGLIAPGAAAIATALDVARTDRDESLLACVMRGIASGLALAALAFLTAILHGLRVGFCDLGGGARGFVLTAGIGAVMGGAWGSVVGIVCRGVKRKRLACTLLALAGPIGSALISVGRFYSSPIVFAFDPFVGYFSGTLYDTVIDAGTALVTYRVGSLSTLGALVLLASARGKSDAGSRARLALAGALAIASLAITWNGAALGHWQTSATIAKDLGGFRAGQRCDVVFPDGQREDQIRLLLSDCEANVAADERVLGARGPEKITAFFFRDAGDKKRLMGAESTYIAKPWRREVYLQLHGYPHPVLGHEIAHVVAGSFGHGPFRIAGGLGGWWPNPGLIEGVAVAASPDEEELTDAQWARAMLDLKILPPIERVFSIRFLGEASSKSYTLAGAFVTWVLREQGSEVVRRWYGGEDIVAITGKSWAALDEGFRAYLASLTLSPEAESFAKGRFDRPSVFGRKCPHVVDAIRREADGCREGMRLEKARVLYGEVLARDPHDVAAKYGLGVIDLRYGDVARGEGEMAALGADADTPRGWRDRTSESIADAHLAAGRADEARATYEALAAKSLDEDQARTLEVKAYAATADDRARDAAVALLVGEHGRPVDTTAAMAKLGAWAEATRDPVAEYVLGKNLINHEEWRDGSEHLERASARGVPTARIARELLKQRAIAACALADEPGVKRLRALLDEPAGPFAGSVGRREWLTRFLDRCIQR